MIKAAIRLTETDFGLGRVRTFLIYEYCDFKQKLSAGVLKELEVPVEDVGPGQTLVARQQTKREDMQIRANVSCYDFLALIGEYNKVKHLEDIRYVD